MPFVNVKVVEGVFSATQKQDIVRKVTDAMVEIEGENMRPVTWVSGRGGRQRRLGHWRNTVARR